MTNPGSAETAPEATPPTVNARRKRLIAAGGLGVTAVVSGIVSLFLLAGTASADPASTPAPSPTLIEANADLCLGDPDAYKGNGDLKDNVAPLSGVTLMNTGSNPSGTYPFGAIGSITVTGTNISVTINAGYTASGIVVKGGPVYNLYIGPFAGAITVTGMTTPTNPNNNQPYGVSHVLVCGTSSPTPTPTTPTPTDPTPTPSEPTPTPSEPTPTTPTPTTPTPTTPTPTTPTPTTPTPTTPTPTTPTPTTPTPTDPSEDPSDPATPSESGSTPSTSTTPGLPQTGQSLTGLIFAGFALVAAGAALLFLRRARSAAGE